MTPAPIWMADVSNLAKSRRALLATLDDLWKHRNAALDALYRIRPESFHEQEGLSERMRMAAQKYDRDISYFELRLAEEMNAREMDGIIWMMPLEMPTVFYLEQARKQYGEAT